MSPKTPVLLSGYGFTGRALTRLLLEHTDAHGAMAGLSGGEDHRLGKRGRPRPGEAEEGRGGPPAG